MLGLYDVFEDSENNCFQIRTKSDVILVEFSEEDKRDIFLKVVDAFKSGYKKYNDLYKELKKSYKENDILEVFKKLDAEYLLTEEYSKSLAEQLNLNGSSTSFSGKIGLVNQQLLSVGSIKLGIIKSGMIADKIREKASGETFNKVNVISPASGMNEKKLQQFVEQQDIIVYDSDHWNPYFLEIINKQALDRDKPWLLIRGIEGVEGSIGPIFWGKKTGCYECLINRLKSNMQALSYFNSYERFLRNTKGSSKSDNYAPKYFDDVLASMALFELNKFVYRREVPETYGAMLTIDFSLSVDKHTLLKSPLCEVCKPSNEYNLSPWLESVTLK